MAATASSNVSTSIEQHSSSIMKINTNNNNNSSFNRNGGTAGFDDAFSKLPLPPRPPPEKLVYDVHSWSSYSANYHPRHVMVNQPNDQSSRWSSGSNNQAQFLTLKLDKMCIIQTITFGKYHKLHVCNLKEFKVFGGMSPDNMTELLHSGLRNDNEPETFSLKYQSKGVIFPCQYIKIIPLLAHGANFNYSIWFLELNGVAQSEYVQQIYMRYIHYREREVVRLVMKHFRQRNMLDLFEILENKTHIQLENNLLAEMNSSLVRKADFATSESLLETASLTNLFDEYILDCKYKPLWKKLVTDDKETPCMRGGHQMCIDSDAGKIYLYGGWNGSQDLADFWVYDIEKASWRCISKDTATPFGPGARSCHKICFDPKMKCIYTLGKYVDADSRPNSNLENDFWRFDTSTEVWTRIAPHTGNVGGPDLIYDHQMTLDAENQIIYVFGGRAISTEPNHVTYSGLYSYDIRNSTWKNLRQDSLQSQHTIQLKSRIGHSMLLNAEKGELYIFAGQRAKDYLSDFYVYEIATDTLHEVSRDYSKSGGPEAGFTQRATFDSNFSEIYVLSGLMKDKASSNETVRNSFWVYQVAKNKWTKIYQNENTGHDYWEKMKDTEPCPRYAHQLVYEPNRRKLYLFGGNPGSVANPKLRLDDFWELGLERPSSNDILRKAKLKLYQLAFKEKCIEAFRQSSPVTTVNLLRSALHYLQNDVYRAVDHRDVEEAQQFKDLTKWLFIWNGAIWASQNEAPSPVAASPVHGNALQGAGMVVSEDNKYTHALRTEVYESLLEFFPEGMKEPTGNLVDRIPLD